MSQAPTFFEIASDRSVMRRASRIALVVGTILIMINQGNTILSGNGTGETVLKCVLTFMVPYCVSTYSSVMAVRDRMQSLEDT